MLHWAVCNSRSLVMRYAWERPSTISSIQKNHAYIKRKMCSNFTQLHSVQPSQRSGSCIMLQNKRVELECSSFMLLSISRRQNFRRTHPYDLVLLFIVMTSLEVSALTDPTAIAQQVAAEQAAEEHSRPTNDAPDLPHWENLVDFEVDVGHVIELSTRGEGKLILTLNIIRQTQTEILRLEMTTSRKLKII